jgi:hypothetical protein
MVVLAAIACRNPSPGDTAAGKTSDPATTGRVTLAADAGTAGDAAASDAAPGVIDAAPMQTIDDVFTRISRGESPLRVCFALSSNHRRAACALGSWMSHESIRLEIAIVGDTGDLESHWTYLDFEQDRDRGRTYDHTPSDPAALARAHQALVDRGYVPSTLAEAEIPLHETVTVDRWTLRHERTVTVPGRAYDPAIDRDDQGNPAPMGGVWEQAIERIELRCGRSWVAVPVDPDPTQYDPGGSYRVSQLSSTLLLIVGETSWVQGEGTHGGARIAAVIDPRSLCAHP